MMRFCVKIQCESGARFEVNSLTAFSPNGTIEAYTVESTIMEIICSNVAVVMANVRYGD